MLSCGCVSVLRPYSSRLLTTPSDLAPMSTSISSLSMRTTVPSTTSPCLRLRISPSCSLSSSSIVVGSGRVSTTGSCSGSAAGAAARSSADSPAPMPRPRPQARADGLGLGDCDLGHGLGARLGDGSRLTAASARRLRPRGTASAASARLRRPRPRPRAAASSTDAAAAASAAASARPALAAVASSPTGARLVDAGDVRWTRARSPQRLMVGVGRLGAVLALLRFGQVNASPRMVRLPPRGRQSPGRTPGLPASAGRPCGWWARQTPPFRGARGSAFLRAVPA